MGPSHIYECRSCASHFAARSPLGPRIFDRLPRGELGSRCAVELWEACQLSGCISRLCAGARGRFSHARPSRPNVHHRRGLRAASVLYTSAIIAIYARDAHDGVALPACPAVEMPATDWTHLRPCIWRTHIARRLFTLTSKQPSFLPPFTGDSGQWRGTPSHH